MWCVMVYDLREREWGSHTGRVSSQTLLSVVFIIRLWYIPRLWQWLFSVYVALILDNIMNIHFHICSFLRHLGEKAHKFSSNKNRKMRSRCLSDLFSPPRNSLCIFGSNNVREITRKKQHKTDCCAHRS